jgi:enolase
MAKIQKVLGRQILDSRGRPTVEVDVISSTGCLGRAIVPSGASTGAHEAIELRDENPSRYDGASVLKAVDHVNGEIARALNGVDLDDLSEIDARLIALDGTPNKRRLGANAILGASLAAAHASAASQNEALHVTLNRYWNSRFAPSGSPDPATLPLPMVNMISGGLHAGRNLDIQDVLIVPLSARSYSDSLEMIVAMYRGVGEILRRRGLESALVGDEGGFGPKLRDNEQALEIVVEAMHLRGFVPGTDVAIALDIASSHFHDKGSGQYRLRASGDRKFDRLELIELLANWVRSYPIVSIEDGLAEDDWEGWTELTNRLGNSVQIIGDDLFTTQVARLQRGIENRAANAILIKVNQIGTLSETLNALALARTHGFRAVVSARSGETEDTTIADLAVATAAGQIKIGSVARSERLAKYNHLLRIEEQLGETARFADGATVFGRTGRP